MTGVSSVLSGGLTPELSEALAESDDEAVRLKAEAEIHRHRSTGDIDLDEAL